MPADNVAADTAEAASSDSAAANAVSSTIVEVVAATVLAAGAPALIFVAGWSILRSYLAPFGIQVFELQMSTWEIAAMSLTGINLAGGEQSGSLDLSWLLFLSLSFASLIIMTLSRTQAWKRAGALGTIMMAMAASLSFYLALGQFSDAGSRLADRVVGGRGALFVPAVSPPTEEGAAQPDVYIALSRCIDEQRLLSIFVIREIAWSFCKSRASLPRGLVFVTNGENRLVSMRRFFIK